MSSKDNVLLIDNLIKWTCRISVGSLGKVNGLEEVFAVGVRGEWVLVLLRALDVWEDNDEAMRCVVRKDVTIHSPLTRAAMHECEKRELPLAGDGRRCITIEDCIIPCDVEELSWCIRPVFNVRHRVTVVPLSSISKYCRKQQKGNSNHFTVLVNIIIIQVGNTYSYIVVLALEIILKFTEIILI